MGRLLETLSDIHRPAGAVLDATLVTPGWYIVALVLARVGLLSRAVACLQACLQQQPADPRTHYTLAQFLSAQNQPAAALQHTLQAWQHLNALESSPQLLHLEILNQLLMLLETTGQYESFSRVDGRVCTLLCGIAADGAESCPAAARP